MKTFLDRLLDWLEKNLPSLLAVGSFIYHFMNKKVQKAEKAEDKAKLAAKKARNEVEILKNNASKSDAAIIAEGIRRGRELKGPDDDGNSGEGSGKIH